MQTALITGASQGLGLEFAKLFAKNGYNLVLVARSSDLLTALGQDLIATYNIRVTVIAQDLSKVNAVDTIVKTLKEKEITVNALVNNAGFATYGLFTEIDAQKEYEEIMVNITTLTLLTKKIAQDMAKRKSGKILMVASTAAFFPGPLMAVYYATKAYVLSFSTALRNELKDVGITVTCLCPGPTKTGFVKRAEMESSKLFTQRVMDASVVARAGFDGLMEGKNIVIPGRQNALLALLSRFVPRELAAMVVRQNQERK